MTGRDRAGRRRGASGRGAVLLVVGLWAIAAPRSALAEDPPPTLRAGSWELGVGGSLTSVAGDTRWSLGIDGAAFLPVARGFAAPGAELAYAHQRALDLLDAGVGVVWLRRLGSSPVFPYLGPGAGIRQEWVGSFRTTRYPVGFDLGLRVPVSSGALVRMEYRFRRILGDPAADYTEHRVGFGLALILGGARPAR